MTQPIPKGYNTLSPHIVVDDAAAAISFYDRAFGAVETARHSTPDGKVMHAAVAFGNSMLMLGDEFPDWGVVGPKTHGGTAVTMHLYVEDADAVFERAVAAGAITLMPLEDTFWGDRYAKVADPFGHHWSIATHQQDMTSEQVEKAAAAAFGG